MCQNTILYQVLVYMYYMYRSYIKKNRKKRFLLKENRYKVTIGDRVQTFRKVYLIRDLDTI